MDTGIILLDVVEAVDIVDNVRLAQPELSVLHFALTIAIEAVLLYVFQYRGFARSALDSLIVNLVSLAVGIFLFMSFGMLGRIFEDPGLAPKLIVFVLCLVLTIGVEGLVLKLMHRGFPTSRLFIVCALMNGATYLLFMLMKQL